MKQIQKALFLSLLITSSAFAATQCPDVTPVLVCHQGSWQIKDLNNNYGSWKFFVSDYSANTSCSEEGSQQPITSKWVQAVDDTYYSSRSTCFYKLYDASNQDIAWAYYNSQEDVHYGDNWLNLAQSWSCRKSQDQCLFDLKP